MDVNNGKSHPGLKHRQQPIPMVLGMQQVGKGMDHFPMEFAWNLLAPCSVAVMKFVPCPHPSNYDHVDRFLRQEQTKW